MTPSAATPAAADDRTAPPPATPTTWPAAGLVPHDVVVSQGCGESCPVFLGARYSDWPLVPDHELPPSVLEWPARR